MATKKAEKSHREKKNGASRDQWEKRKAEANAARPKQISIVDEHVDGTITGRFMRVSA